jgi:hypothetical protein
VKQRFVEHFQYLNLKHSRAKDHGDFELKDLYHERVRIQHKLIKQIWRNNKMEMKTQIMANVIPIFVYPIPNLLHHNNDGVTYVGTFNFKV